MSTDHPAVIRRGHCSETLEVDAYSLFHAYSEMLGWIRQPTVVSGELGSWGMHEAGGDWSASTECTDRNIFWAQVGLPAASKAFGLPVSQLLVCAEKSLSRIGTVSTTGFQMIVPIRADVTIDPSSLSNLLLSSPPETTSLIIEIDGGENEHLGDFIGDVLKKLNLRFQKNRIEFYSAGTLLGSDRLLIEPGEMERDIGLGPSQRRFLLTVKFPELSFDIASTIVEHIAWALRKSGFEGAALITVCRSSAE